MSRRDDLAAAQSDFLRRVLFGEEERMELPAESVRHLQQVLRRKAARKILRQLPALRTEIPTLPSRLREWLVRDTAYPSCTAAENAARLCQWLRQDGTDDERIAATRDLMRLGQHPWLALVRLNGRRWAVVAGSRAWVFGRKTGEV